MKRTLALFGAALLLTSSSYGGADVIIRERAKELRNQNNVRQGVAPPTQGGVPAAPSPSAPPPPPPSPMLARFQTDLVAIKTGSPATPEQTQKLAQDILGTAQGAKPSAAAVNKLAEDLATAFAEKPLPASSRARLATELDAVLNPTKYPQAKMDGIFADVQAIFQENGTSRKTAVAIADDLKTISGQVQRGGA